MPNAKLPIALRAADCAPHTRPSAYPAAMVACIEAQLGGRERRPLGEPFGLTRLDINLIRLAPDAICTLRHTHAVQDEFIYVLQGPPTLVTDAGKPRSNPACAPAFAPVRATRTG
jgi:uncharacterized cupin superfamily protein